MVAMLHTYTLGMRKSINTYVRPSLLLYHGRGKGRKNMIQLKIGYVSKGIYNGRGSTYMKKEMETYK